jgi:peptidoglycan/LPS O-acetylase OafA/YrhL
MTLTFLAILILGKPVFEATLHQWLANLFIAAPALGEQYIDTSYWSLVIEVVFYAWVAVLIGVGLFPRRIDSIILIWFGITFANELTVDLPLIEKLFIADDSGFFAIGLLIHEYYRGRRDTMLYGILALSVCTAIFQALHKLPKLSALTGATFDEWIVVTICLLSVAVIFLASRVRRIPIPASFLIGIGGLTYPLYLLHMQTGYVVFSASAASMQSPMYVAVIVSGISLLSWAVWRYVERPAQRWTKNVLTNCAVRFGWPAKLSAVVAAD